MLRTYPLLLALFGCIFCNAQFSANYGFVNVAANTGAIDPSEPPVAEGLVFGQFRANGVSENPTANSRFSFTDWPLGAQNGSDDYLQMSGSLSGLKYYEVVLRCLPGYTLELKSIFFHVRRTSTGIRNFSVRSSRNNFLKNLTAVTGTNTNLQVLPNDILFWRFDSISTLSDQKGTQVLLGEAFSEITDSVVFRFYAWNAETQSGSFSIDNVSFVGVVKDADFFTGDNNIEEEPKPRIIKTDHPNCVRVLTNDNFRFVIRSSLGVLCAEGWGCQSAIIDLSAFADGVYILAIETAQGTFWKKYSRQSN